MCARADNCQCCSLLLEYPEGMDVLTCPACGTRNKLPDKRVLETPDFKNARELQIRGEFCDAEESYQRVLDNVPDDADALWNRLLCHYGAKLILDKGQQRKYTIHIPRSKPMRAQGDYERACENALPAMREQYEKDAAYIDGALERIRRMADTKPPYDIFICHKTSQPGGGFTEDYGRAYELCDLLEEEGYRVFFAPAVMEEAAAGEDYEATIYHALNTAKVMLVICSDPKLIDSTWVRSEWERYLALRDEGRDVKLIPLLYGGMKASALPRAFQVRSLQAIRMELDGKDNLLANLERFIPREKPRPAAPTVQPAAVPAAPTPVQPAAVPTAPVQSAPAKPKRARSSVLPGVLVVIALLALVMGLDALFSKDDLGDVLPAGSQPVAPTSAPVNGITAAPTSVTTEAPTSTPTAVPTSAPTDTPAPTPTEVPTVVQKGVIHAPYTIDVYSDDTCVITGCANTDPALTIPTQIGGYTVTEIGQSAFEHRTDLTSVVIPYGVKKIGLSAFFNCSNLAYVSLPESLTELGTNAFVNTALTGVTLPSSITTIGDTPFGDCLQLSVILVDDGHPVLEVYDGALYHKEEKRVINYPAARNSATCEIKPGTRIIGSYAFYRCGNLTDLKIPATVTTIRWAGVYECTGLTSVEIPYGVTTIGDWAFGHCKNLTSLSIPSSVTSMGEFAFAYCEKVPAVTIPPGVTVIEQSAFQGCGSLTEVSIPYGVTKISENAFRDCSSLSGVSIPASVELIENGAFAEMGSLTSITIPDKASITGNPFCRCKALREIRVSEQHPSLKIVGTALVDKKSKQIIHEFGGGCTYAIPDGITTINDGAFAYSDLISITIPYSVTTIGSNAFAVCTSLKSLYLPDHVTTIGDGAFSYCGSLKSVEIPAGVSHIGEAAFAGCDQVILLVVHGSYAETYAREHGLTYVYREWIHGGELVAAGKIVGDYRIDAYSNGTCNIIGYTGSARELAIPGKLDGYRVTQIGNNAFHQSALEKVVIPYGVTHIGDHAFSHSYSLKEVVLPTSLASLGNFSFCDCTSLQRIDLPDSVTNVYRCAFWGCTSLTSFTFPRNAIYVGENPLGNCPALTKVNVAEGNPRLEMVNGVLFDKVEKRLIYYPLNRTDSLYTIPAGTRVVGESAFKWNGYLTTVKFPDSLERIDDYAFDGCGQLAFSSLPNGVYYIGRSGFYGCRALKDVELPESLRFIGEYAFTECSSLTGLTIPPSVVEIGENVFRDCASLTLRVQVGSAGMDYAVANKISYVNVK